MTIATTLSDDYANSVLTTGKLAVGASVNATFAQPQDSDWFAVTLTAGTEYLFTLATATTRPTYSDAWLAVNDGAGHPLAYSTYSTSAQNLVVDFRPTTSGLYYVSADLDTYDSGATAPLAYSLTAAVRTAPDDFAPGADGAGALTPAAAYEVASGVFEIAGDRDWFKFHATAGTFYNISSTTRALPGTPAATVAASTIFIVDANGEQVPSSLGGKFNALASGDYYIDVAGMTPGKYNIVSVATADDYAATDAGAGRIAPGATVGGLMQFDGDSDSFAVTLAANQYYTFSLAGPQQNYEGLRLVGPDGASLGYAPSGYASTSFSAYAAVAGDYHLVVSNTYLMTANGAAVPYTISASAGRADDIGDSPDAAAPLAVGAAVHAALQGKGDIDMFKVTLQAGTTYNFALAPDAGANAALSLTLRDADGAVIAAGSYGNLANGSYTPSRTGDFYAAVGTGAVLAASVPYTLAISSPVGDVGASAATSAALAIGATVAGKIDAGGGDRDWFGVELNAGTTYWFTVADTAAGTSATIRLLDATGAPITPTGASSAAAVRGTLPYLAERSGTVYLEVAAAASSGAYTVAAAVGQRDDHGNTPAGAGALTPSAPASGRFELASDTDMYKVGLVAGVTYTIDAHAVGGVNGSARLTLSDSAGAAIPVSPWLGAPGGIVFTATRTGDAYVTAASTTGPFDYVVTQVDRGVDDYLTGSATTGVLAIGVPATGALTYAGDVDSLRVHLDAGVAYGFQLRAAASGGGSAPAVGVTFNVQDAYGQVVGRAAGASVDPRWGFTPASAGDYYVTVASAYSLALGTYTVTATSSAADHTAPTVASQSGAPGVTGVGLTDTAMSFTFSEPVAVDLSAITLKNSAGATLLTTSYVLNDRTLSFKAYFHFAPGAYTISLPHAAIHDLAGNAYAGAETIAFTTVLPGSVATEANDLLSGGAGIRIDGGAGVDTVIYAHGQFATDVVRVGNGATVFDYRTGLTDTLVNVERALFDDQLYVFDIDGHGGQAYRLYQAAFNRTPDDSGLGFWLNALDNGVTLDNVARSFIGSAEFTRLYGAAPSDEAFARLLYQNVLHREPDAGGLAWWVNALHNGAPRDNVLTGFSESAENVAALVGVIGHGYHFVV